MAPCSLTVTGGSSGRTTRVKTAARSSTASMNRPFMRYSRGFKPRLCLCTPTSATIEECEPCRGNPRFPGALMPRRPTSLVSQRTTPRPLPRARPVEPVSSRSRRGGPVRGTWRSSLLGRLLRLILILTILGLVIAGGIVIWAAYDLPRPESAMDAERRPALVLQDRTGQTFATYGDLVGEPLRLADMPTDLPAALVAVEDHRFYQHSGIDFISLARAAWVNLSSGRLVQGGSTITQQVAKTLFLTNERTLRR